MQMRTKIERFLSLLTRNSAISKRIAAARSEFEIADKFLTDLRNAIANVKEKQEYVSAMQLRLADSKEALKGDI